MDSPSKAKSEHASSSSSVNSKEWTRTGVALLPWLVPAATCIRLRYDLLVSHTAWGEGGFDLLGRYLGVMQFTPWERLALFRTEVLAAFLVVPGLLLLLLRYLPGKMRALLAGGLSAIVFTVLAVEGQALNAVGGFISFDLFWPAYLWGQQDPTARQAYLPARALEEYAGGMILIILLAWWGARQQKRMVGEDGGITHAILVRAAIYLPLIACGLWLIPLPALPMQTPVLWTSVRALWGDAEVDTREFGGMSLAELRARYRELAKAPEPQPSPYAGRARGYNVLYLVMETAPARCADLDSYSDDFPNFASLSHSAFIGSAHYATYLHTHANLFSIFSGWYPSSMRKNFTDEYPGRRVPGLLRDLVASGYEAAVYSPVRSAFAITDEPLFAALGFPAVRYPNQSVAEVMPPLHLEDKLAADRAALELLKSDLRRWTSADQRFVAAFLPQIGHAPWPDVRSRGAEKNIVQRGHNIISLQDQWLGEVISLLRETGALEHTLIVVTGDHGIRTRVEDPDFREGMLDDYSYHVPLLIYAPRVLSQTKRIGWATSHVDISPTLADLLGVTQGREGEQGVAIWTPGLAARTTFLFARSYAGADGYYRDRHFFMQSHLSGLAYKSSELHFEPQDVVPAHSLLEAEITATIGRMTALQQVWLARFSTPGQ